MTMKKLISNVVLVISLIALAGIPAFAAETMSPAKRKMLEKTKKEGVPSTPATESEGPKTAQLDLNKATKKQLMTLPGIGEAEADKIIAGRPYISKTQLRKKEIIPLALFYEISDRVAVDVAIKKYEPPLVAAPVKKKDEKPQKKQDAPKKDVFKEFGK